MEHKSVYIKNSLFVVVGIVAGWLFWGQHTAPNQVKMEKHLMPDGTMMHGGDADMAAMMMDMNASLKGKTGDLFDEAFLSEMILHHQGAIDMAQLALTSAKQQEIKNLANEIIAAQTKEIAQMKEWQKNWYDTSAHSAY